MEGIRGARSPGTLGPDRLHDRTRQRVAAESVMSGLRTNGLVTSADSTQVAKAFSDLDRLGAGRVRKRFTSVSCNHRGKVACARHRDLHVKEDLLRGAKRGWSPRAARVPIRADKRRMQAWEPSPGSCGGAGADWV